MAKRQVQSQVIATPAVRPVQPTQLDDVTKLIAATLSTAQTAIGVQAREFQQERQLSAVERQAEAAENRLEVEKIQQEQLENDIESAQLRLTSEEARVEIRKLKGVEARGIQAILDTKPVEELEQIFAAMPHLDPAAREATETTIGKMLAEADQNNALQRFRQSVSAEEGIEGPPVPLSRNISDVLSNLIEERQILNPRIRATYEQSLLRPMRVAAEGITLSREALNTKRLVNAAQTQDQSDNYALFDSVQSGEIGGDAIKADIDRRFPTVSAMTKIGLTEHINNMADDLAQWAATIEDPAVALRVVQDVINQQEHYGDRLRPLQADLRTAVKRQKQAVETKRVSDIFAVEDAVRLELGNTGSQSLSGLKRRLDNLPNLNLPAKEQAVLSSRYREEIKQVGRALGERVQLQDILDGKQTGIVSAPAASQWYVDNPQLTIPSRLATLATAGQLMPTAAAQDIETLIGQVPEAGIAILREVDSVSSNAVTRIIKQMKKPAKPRRLLNTTRGLAKGDQIFDQIISAHESVDADIHASAAISHLAGTLPKQFNAKGEEIPVQIGASAFPQSTLIERFSLAEGTRTKESVIKDFEDHYVVGWMIANTDQAFAPRSTTDKIAFARSFAADAIDRRYVLLPKADGTSEFVRADKLGLPINGAASEKELNALGTRFANAVADQELQFGTELTIDVDATQIGEGMSWVPIGGMAVTEDAEGPQYVAFLELDHASKRTRTISASTGRAEFDQVRKLFGDESERLDPSVRLRWTPDKGSPVAGKNPMFTGAIAQDMIEEGRKAWVDIVGGRPNLQSAEFGTFMDNFLRQSKWQGAFPRPLLLEKEATEPITSITFGPSRAIIGDPRAPNVPGLLGPGRLAMGFPTPAAHNVPEGTDITTIPNAMEIIFELANGNPDLAAKIARRNGWFVPEDDS